MGRERMGIPDICSSKMVQTGMAFAEAAKVEADKVAIEGVHEGMKCLWTCNSSRVGRLETQPLFRRDGHMCSHI